MKKVVFTLLASLSGLFSWAQESQTVYNFLRLPVSAHAAAVGGEIVSIVDDDATMVFSNPALLCNVTDGQIGLNYMSYMQGVKTLSASYNTSIMPRGNIAFSAQYMDYGKMKEMNADGVQTGDFNAKDIALAGHFSYMLSDRLSAGITAKFITSYIGNYNSLGVGVDLGANYYDEEKDISISAVVKNLGGQLKAYNDDYEPIPTDIQVGVSKRLVHTPLRFNGTLVNLNHMGDKFRNHLVVGADLLLSQTTWVGLGYNFRRAEEMTIGRGDDESAHGAGLSLGGGLNLDRFKVNIAWGKYHVSSNSLLINLAYQL